MGTGVNPYVGDELLGGNGGYYGRLEYFNVVN